MPKSHTLLWERYPAVANNQQAKTWITIQANLGLASNTLDAYSRALQDYLAFSAHQLIDPTFATREHVAAYVHDLATRPNQRAANVVRLDSRAGLSNATMQQRVTAIRLFYDYLIEEEIRNQNPVGRGKYTPGKSFGGKRDRGLIPHFHKLPWIPNNEQWLAILEAARQEPLRPPDAGTCL